MEKNVHVSRLKRPNINVSRVLKALASTIIKALYVYCLLNVKFDGAQILSGYKNET